MFGSLRWERLFVLAFLALVIFDPERLPGLAGDAAKALHKFRNIAAGAHEHLAAELGPEFGEMDLESLNACTFVRKHLFDGTTRDLLGDPFTVEQTIGSHTIRPLTLGEPAPYYLEAT